MKNPLQYIVVPIAVIMLISCQEESSKARITVTNTLDIPRQFETVSLSKELLQIDDLRNLGIRERETQKTVITQLIDVDGNGTIDEILFQPEISANSEKTFELYRESEQKKPVYDERCYSRFVPERTDDYAWENNRVAFRTYGPTAQQMAENGIAGGTLSSGIDAWLKKVDYPIINKWYKKELETDGTYHEDNGEGLDNFHVGVSRGVGGTAVKKDTSYYSSKNFTQWKTICNGPIRTSFSLKYETWPADDKSISEEKFISLDYGSNFSRFEVHVEGTDELSVGLTLHENDGVVSENPEYGYVSYWQPHRTSELGTAIIASSNTIAGFEKFVSKEKDKSNAYAHLEVQNGKVIYYAGFGWKESGQFRNKDEWESYILQFAKKMNNPITVTLAD